MEDPSTSQAQGAAAVLDADSLDRLRELGEEIGNERFLEQMAETFLECMPSIGSLRQKMAAVDRDAVVNMAHSLRGNSTSFGALRLAELAAELESRADQGALAEPWQGWEDFLEEYERVSVELRKLSAGCGVE